MFETRSYEKEMLDSPVIGKELLYQNLKELNTINSLLGGHAISVDGINKVIAQAQNSLSIMDVGCGGGDNLRAICNAFAHKNILHTLIGVDLKPDCIEYAKSHSTKFPNIQYLCDDFKNAFQIHKHIDIVHAALFCHHFKEDEIVDFIKLCLRKRAIFIINDLQRHPLAYYGIKILTTLFSKSTLVKNDAPLSVLRGFKKVEWQRMLEAAGASNYTIHNRWAFRHLIIIYPDEFKAL